MLNFRMLLWMWSRVGWTSRWIIPFWLSIATADPNYLKILNVWNRLISDFENCFQALMWSGASVRSAIELISSKNTMSSTKFRRFGWLMCRTFEMNWSNCWCSCGNFGAKFIMVIKLSFYDVSDHSIKTSPSPFCE